MIPTCPYNARGLLTRLQNSTRANTLLSDFGVAGGMQYDAVGNRTSLASSVPGVPAASGSTGYEYESKNELTQEQSGRNGSYTFGFAYEEALSFSRKLTELAFKSAPLAR